MATRSRIGKQLEDGTVKYIYCHYDGYPEYNGRILKEHYITEAKIDALLELGDLSILGPEIGEKQDFDDQTKQNQDWCLAYGRDRGEDDTAARIKPRDKYINQEAVDYVYLFENGEWNCYEYKGKSIPYWFSRPSEA